MDFFPPHTFIKYMDISTFLTFNNQDYSQSHTTTMWYIFPGFYSTLVNYKTTLTRLNKTLTIFITANGLTHYQQDYSQYRRTTALCMWYLIPGSYPTLVINKTTLILLINFLSMHRGFFYYLHKCHNSPIARWEAVLGNFYAMVFYCYTKQHTLKLLVPKQSLKFHLTTYCLFRKSPEFEGTSLLNYLDSVIETSVVVEENAEASGNTPVKLYKIAPCSQTLPRARATYVILKYKLNCNPPFVCARAYARMNIKYLAVTFNFNNSATHTCMKSGITSFHPFLFSRPGPVLRLPRVSSYGYGYLTTLTESLGHMWRTWHGRGWRRMVLSIVL